MIFQSFGRLFLGFLVLLFLFSANICLAQTKSTKNETEPETFLLSFILKSRLNPEFRLCVPITEEIPFKVEWLNHGIKSSLSVIIEKPVEGKYPVMITVEEGTKESKIYSGMEKPSLMLDKPYKSIFIASSLFNNTYENNINISRKSCNFEEGSPFFNYEKEQN